MLTPRPTCAIKMMSLMHIDHLEFVDIYLLWNDRLVSFKTLWSCTETLIWTLPFGPHWSRLYGENPGMFSSHVSDRLPCPCASKRVTTREKTCCCKREGKLFWFKIMRAHKLKNSLKSIANCPAMSLFVIYQIMITLP